MARVSGLGAQNSHVYLNVYDLTEQNDMLYQVGLGMYHSGVHIGREEYTFASEAGIFTHDPKQAPGAKLREIIDMGVYKGTSGDLSKIIAELRQKYGGGDYNLLSRNCNNFADDLLQRLMGKELPGYVNRMASIGSYFSCLLPADMTGNAPVNQDGQGGGGSGGSGSGGGGGSYGSNYSGSSVSNPISKPVQAFSGSGNKLGSSINADSVGLNDRRERMRAAAVARTGTSSD